MFVITMHGVDEIDELKAYLFFSSIGVYPNIKFDGKNNVISIHIPKYRDFIRVLSEIDKPFIPSVLRLDNEIEKNAKLDLSMKENTISRKLHVIIKLMKLGSTYTRLVLDVNVAGIERDILEYILRNLIGDEDLYVTSTASRHIVVWGKADKIRLLRSVNLTRYIYGSHEYECPVCGYKSQTLAELQLHYFTEHNSGVCPLDGLPTDEHMLSDMKHLAYAFLALLPMNSHLNRTKLYKKSYILAKFTFNVKPLIVQRDL
ncbi:hypothetical protein AZ270_gp53 [Acidianus tailed spindle virus]|uniref:hypothetical protein n=1 Tax=Acidianus tailed spindle virus TaxID=1797140 RepID=UPI00076F2F86|nr:hypothetical protein AZ270_gp53 [Acidianus tailed spindle virus]AME30076.1 hypothetical protein ATSV_A258 [Acidianus tailed spindle virus]